MPGNRAAEKAAVLGPTRPSGPARTAPLAPVVDLLCLVVFVLLGRESHGVADGPGWFLTVLWPMVAGWFVVALVVRLYITAHLRWRLGLTALTGIAAGLLLRAAVTHRPTPIAFVVVAYVFIAASTGGWRLLASALSRRGRPA